MIYISNKYANMMASLLMEYSWDVDTVSKLVIHRYIHHYTPNLWQCWWENIRWWWWWWWWWLHKCGCRMEYCFFFTKRGEGNQPADGCWWIVMTEVKLVMQTISFPYLVVILIFHLCQDLTWYKEWRPSPMPGSVGYWSSVGLTLQDSPDVFFSFTDLDEGKIDTSNFGDIWWIHGLPEDPKKSTQRWLFDGHPNFFHRGYAGYERWRTGWSDAKKHWCCDRFGKGCPHKERSVE